MFDNFDNDCLKIAINNDLKISIDNELKFFVVIENDDDLKFFVVFLTLKQSFLMC